MLADELLKAFVPVEGRKDYKKPPNGLCIFNKQVGCDEDRCESCGWNPPIAKKRVKRFLEEG